MRGKTASMSSKVVSIGIPNAVQPTRMRSMDGVQVGRFRPIEVRCAKAVAAGIRRRTRTQPAG